MNTNQVDVKLAQAGQILLEMAKEAEIDLEALSDEDLATLLAQIREEMDGREGGGEEVDEGGEGGEPEEKLSADVTFADVAAELAKFAQAEGIDMAKVSRAEYHEAFEAMAQQMVSPDYAEQKVAEAEAFEKLAEADIIGRQMARSFMDEMKTAGAVDRVRGAVEALGGAAARSAGRGADKTYMAAVNAAKGGKETRAKLLGRLSGGLDRASGAMHGNKALTGAGIIGAGGLATGGAVGGAYAAGKSRGGRD
jgi:hypothetical protein